MSLCLDTSVWYAAADKSDINKSRAKAILLSGEPLITIGWDSAAERFWEGPRSGIAAVETVGAADLDSAWEIGRSYRDRNFDCGPPQVR